MSCRRESVERTVVSGPSDRRPMQVYLNSTSRRPEGEGPEDAALWALAVGKSSIIALNLVVYPRTMKMPFCRIFRVGGGCTGNPGRGPRTPMTVRVGGDLFWLPGPQLQ
jgi:hypothetical protein